jgi:hypothetical protein
MGWHKGVKPREKEGAKAGGDKRKQEAKAGRKSKKKKKSK